MSLPWIGASIFVFTAGAVVAAWSFAATADRSVLSRWLWAASVPASWRWVVTMSCPASLFVLPRSRDRGQAGTV